MNNAHPNNVSLASNLRQALADAFGVDVAVMPEILETVTRSTPGFASASEPARSPSSAAPKTSPDGPMPPPKHAAVMLFESAVRQTLGTMFKEAFVDALMAEVERKLRQPEPAAQSPDHHADALAPTS